MEQHNKTHFGFKDVEYILEEYLFHKVSKKPKLISGTAIRILMDIIYPGKSISDIENGKDQKSFLF